MPATQLAELLEREYGSGWHRRFKQFSFAPIAAASIGQVHRAEIHAGEVLALKVQYPGVRASIDCDVANLGLLLRVPGMYDFGASSLVKEVFAQGQAQFFDAGYGQPPPADVLLLQRKFVGTFLLCARLGARVDLGEVFGAELDEVP